MPFRGVNFGAEQTQQQRLQASAAATGETSVTHLGAPRPILVRFCIRIAQNADPVKANCYT